MAKVRLDGNQLTLPDELRNILTAAEGESLEAEEVGEGVLLKRSPSARRRAGLEDVRSAQAGIRYVGSEPRPPADDEERDVAGLLAADKNGTRSKPTG